MSSQVVMLTLWLAIGHVTSRQLWKKGHDRQQERSRHPASILPELWKVQAGCTTSWDPRRSPMKATGTSNSRGKESGIYGTQARTIALYTDTQLSLTNDNHHTRSATWEIMLTAPLDEQKKKGKQWQWPSVCVCAFVCVCVWGGGGGGGGGGGVFFTGRY
jgi:hypothetical protein